MKSFKAYLLLATGLMFFNSCKDDEPQPDGILQLQSIQAADYEFELGIENTGVPVDEDFTVHFNAPLEPATAVDAFSLKDVGTGAMVPLSVALLQGDQAAKLGIESTLLTNTAYELSIATSLRGREGEGFPGIAMVFITAVGELAITSVLIDGKEGLNNINLLEVHRSSPEIAITFSEAVASDDILSDNFRVAGKDGLVPATVSASTDRKTITLSVQGQLTGLERYSVNVRNTVNGDNGETFAGYSRYFYTEADETPKFPVISDDELLTLVQQQTFKYFWDFGHPVSGMARERDSSGDLVTTGGTGFALMSITVGMHRNFITRQQGVERLEKIINFLSTADRFHGAWPHWMNGVTGAVIPFSAQDNGGDLVETAFLIQGMLTARQYLNPSDPEEAALISLINELWHGVEWDWYTQSGAKDVLYWHWSPDLGWAMNHEIRGHNETLIAYVLAASSPTHPIPASTYHNGYARGGGMKNGRSFFNITLPLGEDYGGPLFFAHYSFLGLDPRQLSDAYADYWEQNTNHTLINRSYVISNPRKFAGYSQYNWGLTASDNFEGYSAHSPTNDIGVISPTAALSSFPYTPEYSMEALRFFYYSVGDRLWGDYGFKDAFSIHEGWYASSYLAIDQGPIILMIENYRSGLLWDLFMSNPEVQSGLTDLGFDY